MKLATHRTTTVPRKGPTIIQNYKKKLEARAKAEAKRAEEKARDAATRGHLGISEGEYAAIRKHWGRFADGKISTLETRRLAQAFQGPQLPTPKDFLPASSEKPLSWWGALKAVFSNPYPNPH